MMKQIWQHKTAAILAFGLAAGAASAACANGRRDIPNPQQPVQSVPSADANGAFPPAPAPANGAADGQPAADGAEPNAAAGNNGGAALWPSVAAQQQAAPAGQTTPNAAPTLGAAPAAVAPSFGASPDAAPAAGAAAPANTAPGSADSQQQLRDLQNQIQALQQKLNNLEGGRTASAGQTSALAQAAPVAQAAPATAAAVSAAAAKAPPAAAEETPTYQVPANISADDLYQQGREFMVGESYANAGVAWQAFADRFPQDSRAADAAFLVGECYYARGLYAKAAEAYLKGRTKYKDAAVAPQNLLKLALSMKNLDDKGTACATIIALQRDYRNAPAAVLERAGNAAREMQCP